MSLLVTIDNTESKENSRRVTNNKRRNPYADEYTPHLKKQKIEIPNRLQSNPLQININVHHNSNRKKLIDGISFNIAYGDKLNDYQNLQVSADRFVYNESQCILVVGECDFSYSKAVINQRNNNGSNMCVTSWYYYSSQWYYAIPKEIGWQQFSVFITNLKYCKQKGAKVTFGIDAKCLHKTENKWNKMNAITNKFDVVIFTLPRIHDETWTKIGYNQENKLLLKQILKSVSDYLNDNGQIHILFLKGQFCNWRIRKILNELDLEIAFWSEFDKDILRKHFNGYTPRDCYGNAMKIEYSQFHFCCFKKKIHNVTN